MLIILSSKMRLKSITEKIRRTIFGVAMLSELYKMNKEEIAEKIAKLVLIVAGLSLLYFVAYLVFPFSPEEGSIWETLSLISIVPIIIWVYTFGSYASRLQNSLPSTRYWCHSIYHIYTY